MSSANNANASAAADWLAGAAHTCYDFAVVLYSRGFGEQHAHTVVGGLSLTVFGLLTALAAWYVFREVAEIGFKVLRVVLMLGVVFLMMSLLGSLFTFVFPSPESRREAHEVVRKSIEQASNTTQTYVVGKLWSRLFGDSR